MLLVASVLALAAAQPTLLAPASRPAKPKWSIDYAPNACILTRARDGAAGGFRLETRPFEVDHKFALLLPKSGKGSFARPGRLSVPDPRPPYPVIVTVEEKKEAPDRLVQALISDSQLALLVGQATLGVTSVGKLDEQVSMSGLAKALLALDRCEEDLTKRWGTPRTWAIDPQPLSGPMGMIRNEDYPPSLVELNQQGTARIMLQIDSAGDIQRCRTIDLTGPAAFAEITCAAYKKRLRFTPAKDSTGASVPSYYVLPEVRFILAG